MSRHRHRRADFAWAARASTALYVACSDPQIPGDAAFARCPNAACEQGESSATCPQDCPACNPSDCIDDNPCTVDTCDPKVGCSHKAVGGGPCEKGPCFEEGSCVQGQCQAAPRLWAWSSDVGAGMKDTATAVVRDSDGAMVVAVEAWQAAPGSGVQHDNFVLRIAPGGVDLSKPPTRQALEPDPNHDDALAAMAALAGGGALAVGSQAELLPVNGKAPRTRARWIGIARPGSPNLPRDHLDVDGDHWFSAVARASDGTLLAVGGLDQQGFAKRFFADAEPSWNLPVAPPAGATGRLRAVTSLPGSKPRWMAVGHANVGNQLRGWAVELGATGTATGSEVVVTPDEGWHGTLLAVAPHPAGGVVAAGVASSAWFGDLPELPTARVWWVHIPAGGAAPKQQRGEQNRWPVALFALPTGGWLAPTLLHPATSAGATSLLTLDAELRERAATAASLPYVAGAALWPDGTLALVGQIAVQGQGDAWMARVDRWANPDCAHSGMCLATPALDCGDGNACTADVCKQGTCNQAALPAGAGCGTTGQCKGNTCEKP
ncbi:MAG: hypothetical protein FJ100_19435 [Deltaproteobacteria bacterium]|nr:hypothetical protein [Deltaproteobacteria bacterium]